MNQESESQKSPGSMTLKIDCLEGLGRDVLSELEAIRNGELSPGKGINLREEVRRFEADLIRCALRRTGGNQRRAAELLGLKTTTLCTKIKLYKLSVRKDSASGEESGTRP